MIVFHGSPRYFGKFNNDKIGTARDYNPVQGHYFSEDINTALQYKRKYLYDNKFSLAFLQDVVQPISGYLYVCEVPEKSELLDLSQEIADAPESVRAAISNILKDPAFSGGYFKRRKDDTIEEFIKRYSAYCEAKKIHSMIPNVYRGYKGVIWNYNPLEQTQGEIVIFDAKDIQVKQCFIITQVRSNINVNPEYNKSDIISVLFKRFGDYYYANGSDYKSCGVLMFHTHEDCPEVLDEVQTFDELEQNPFVIAYIVSKPVYSFSVVEANINSLNYNPRSKTRPKKANIYTVGDIQAILNCGFNVYTPVKSKIVNLAEFAEYKRQADSYKYLRKFNPFTINAAFDTLGVDKTNTLFLQRAEKPYFNLNHVTLQDTEILIKYIQEQKAK